MGKSFKVDARAIITFGRDSIKDNTTALLELVKNSYDADASVVEIDIYCKALQPFIRIADNGSGMTDKEIENNWLRLGFSEKRNNKYSTRNRRKTGEKGIGRISADRLGAEMILKTKAKDKGPVGLHICWNDFNVDNKDISSIPIEEISDIKLNLPKQNGNDSLSGTEMVISDLRQQWTENDLRDLFNELSLLTPPFKQVKDFQIIINNDISKIYCGKVESSFIDTAEITLNAFFENNQLKYTLINKYLKKPFSGSIDWEQLNQIVDLNIVQKDLIDIDIGPIEIILLFYPRKASLLEGTEYRLSDLREFLDKNSGIKIYRDDIRVKPYGNPDSPEGDWLGLAERKSRDPAGVARSSFKVSTNQIVGAIFLSRDKNNALIDSTAREGLIHSTSYYKLIKIAHACIRTLEMYRHDYYSKQEKAVIAESKSPSQDIKYLENELKILKGDLQTVMTHMPKTSKRQFERTIDQVNIVTGKITSTQESIDELISQTRVYRGLATIGIASAVFGHETQSSISEFIASATVAKDILTSKPSMKTDAIEELGKSVKYAKQVAAWGAFALARLSRDKRRKKKLYINKIIEDTINEISPVFLAPGIIITTSIEKVEAKTFAMDIEAVLLNLLTNAYTACMQVKKTREINVELKKESQNGINGFTIITSDSGPGISNQIINNIWTPLFTTKVDDYGKEIGTGLGLSIVSSIINDLNGKYEVIGKGKNSGATFKIWFPL